MRDISELKIENGWVIGYVSTKKVDSECEVLVCTVEEYSKLSEDELYNRLEEVAWESGQIELYF